MPKYHAVFKKEGSATPLTVLLTAASVTDAIIEMCTAAGVSGTTSITEFEILEVLGSDKYARVAMKPARVHKSAEQRIAAHQAPVTPPAPAGEITEQKYTPYTKQLAA